MEFFSPDYQQDLNGKVYSFSDFLKGVADLKKQLGSIRVQFTKVVSSGDTIAEIHVVEAVKKDGSPMKFKVIAFQTLERGRIVRAEEVNSPL